MQPNEIAAARFNDVLSRVTMPGMTFFVGLGTWTGFVIYGMYLQVKCDGKCNITGEPQKWSGRKWMLSEFMTDQEIVQTALKAVLTAQEHETREMFKYRGVPIFDPHYDIEALVQLRESGAVVQRKKREQTGETKTSDGSAASDGADGVRPQTFRGPHRRRTEP